MTRFRRLHEGSVVGNLESSWRWDLNKRTPVSGQNGRNAFSTYFVQAQPSQRPQSVAGTHEWCAITQGVRDCRSPYEGEWIWLAAMRGASHTPDWPAELAEVFERSTTCEYASLTRAGAPVTVPLAPFVGAGTLDVSTGLAFPAKAERARRNPKVALLFADPIGAGMSGAPVVLVQGHAAVRDANLQAGTDRYVRAALAKYPAATKNQPKFMLRRLAWYWARIWVEVTPVRIRWWQDRNLMLTPREWRAGEDLKLPQSDPAPPGRQPPPWLDPPREWRKEASRALTALPLADLTVVDGDGYPLCVPVVTTGLVGGYVSLKIGNGAPEMPVGPACLTLHGHPEI